MSGDYEIRHRDGRYWVYKDGRLKTVHQTLARAEQKVQQSLAEGHPPKTSLRDRLRSRIGELYDTDARWPGPLRCLQVIWMTLVGIWLSLMALAVVALIAVLAYWLGSGAVEFVADHPGSARAVALELLVGGAVVFALFGVLGDRLPDVVSAVLAWIAIVVVLGGVVAFASSDDPRVKHRAERTGQSFCDVHQCIPSFDAGRGSIVQCADGEWSHSGGVQGACSSHGGIR